MPYSLSVDLDGVIVLTVLNLSRSRSRTALKSPPMIMFESGKSVLSPYIFKTFRVGYVRVKREGNVHMDYDCCPLVF